MIFKFHVFKFSVFLRYSTMPFFFFTKCILVSVFQSFVQKVLYENFFKASFFSRTCISCNSNAMLQRILWKVARGNSKVRNSPSFSCKCRIIVGCCFLSFVRPLSPRDTLILHWIFLGGVLRHFASQKFLVRDSRWLCNTLLKSSIQSSVNLKGNNVSLKFQEPHSKIKYTLVHVDNL